MVVFRQDLSGISLKVARAVANSHMARADAAIMLAAILANERLVRRNFSITYLAFHRDRICQNVENYARFCFHGVENPFRGFSTLL